MCNLPNYKYKNNKYILNQSYNNLFFFQQNLYYKNNQNLKDYYF